MTDISLFDYELPKKLIAQYPKSERDASRLLVVHRNSGATEDRLFSELPEYLREGDVLVFNNSRVIKARLKGTKKGTGANIEIFLIRKSEVNKQQNNRTNTEKWEALARPARRLKIGDEIIFNEKLFAVIEEKKDDGFFDIELISEKSIFDEIERVGHVPLPPYIRRIDEEEDAERYQCVYAENPGSVAAPTAGLHFTESLLNRIQAKGAETVFITLHVGIGTFRPVATEMIEEHQMHAEYYHINDEARIRINRAKNEGRRIICVGTTSLRTIESAGVFDSKQGWYIPEINSHGETDIFIFPGSRSSFFSDGLITNFHLPRSTLLMLVSAFYERDNILKVYRDAIRKEYRFFSYGDAMLIL